MRFSKKKKFVAVLVCCLILSLSLIGCAKNDPISKFELAKETTAEIGTDFTLPSAYVEDTSGNRLFSTIKVTDPTSEDVAVNDGKIFISQFGEYIAVYTVTVKETDYSQSLKITVVDKMVPNISIDKYSIFTAKGKTVEVPQIRVTDNSSEALTAVLTLITPSNEEIALTENSFVASEEGVYTIRVSATDSNGNTNTKSIKVTSAYAQNTAMYFGYEGGEAMASAIEGVNLRFTDTIKHSNETGTGSLNVSSTFEYTDVVFESPAIADISSYSSLYFYIYNNSEFDVNISFNQVYNVSKIPAKSWGLAQAINYADGWIKYPSESTVTNSAFYKMYDWETVDNSDRNPATAQNIDKFRLTVQGKDGQQTDVYISSVKVSEVGFAPEVILSNMPVANATESYEILLPKVVENGENITAEISKVSVVLTDGTVEEIKAVDNKYSFTPAFEGLYKVNFEVTDSALRSAYYTANVYAVSADNKNVLMFDKPFALNGVTGNGNTKLTIDTNNVKHGETHSLKVESNHVWTEIKLNAPIITDISAYETLTYYFYNDSGYDLKVFANLLDRRVVKSGQWTMFEFKKSNDWSSIFNGEARFPQSDSNITNFTIVIEGQGTEDYTGVKFYLSAPVVSTELTEKATITLPELTPITSGEYQIPLATIDGGTGNTVVSYKVFDSEYNKIAVSADNKIIVEEGIYTVVYTVIDEAFNVVAEQLKLVCLNDYQQGDVYWLDRQDNKTTIKTLDGTTVSHDTKSAPDSVNGSLKVQSSLQYVELIFGQAFLSNVRDFDTMYFWVYNDSSTEHTFFINNKNAHFTLKPQQWNLVELVKNEDNVYTYVNGGTAEGFNGDMYNAAVGGFSITFVNKVFGADPNTTFFISAIKARMGRAPVITQSIPTSVMLGDEVSVAGIIAKDFNDQTVSAEVEVFDPNGNIVSLTDSKFLITVGGKYKVIITAQDSYGNVNQKTYFIAVDSSRKLIEFTTSTNIDSVVTKGRSEIIAVMQPYDPSYSYLTFNGEPASLRLSQPGVWDEQIKVALNFESVNLNNYSYIEFNVYTLSWADAWNEFKIKMTDGNYEQVTTLIKGEWTNIRIEAKDFAKYFGDDLNSVNKISIFIGNIGGNSTDYQYFISNVYIG